jgi:dipeptidyl aminopeptidase/acylaminoacyl peptidase
MKHHIRTRLCKDIVVEVAIPSVKNSKAGRVLILLGGAPSTSSKPEVLNFWASKGYICILPRFRGTWESDGEFLKESPHIDVLDIIQEITAAGWKGITDVRTGELLKLKAKSIYIIGGSFGGTAALLCSSHKKVKKVVALAPGIDWSYDSIDEPFSVFKTYTQQAFGSAYRAKATSWNKLQNNSMYAPVTVAKELPGNKILILHALDDTVVSIDPVYSFVRDSGAALVEYKRGGHMGLNTSRKAKYYKKIESFFE